MVVHDLIPRLFPVYQGNFRKKFYWRMVERALRHVDHIVAVSEATKKDLIDFGIVEQKILVASPDTAPGFAHEPTPEESARVMARYGLTPGYIYHGGGLEVRKNAEGLLRAYKLLVEKETAVMTTLPPLVISGKIFQGHNPLATPVTKLIKELGLTERVRLLGFVPESDLPALYKNALFFVYPSLYEGFGLPVLEALRMRTPVLTSDGSSLPEVAGGAAMYVDPTDRAALASGMERLMRDASLREQLCAAAPQAGARFQWQNFVAAVLGTFQKENI